MKKLAIVGSGPQTREQAPFDDPSFDIWVFNEAANSKWCKRWTACFQMHAPNIYKGHNTKDASHWEWLQKKHGKPIYMQAQDPDVPDCVPFPLDEARKVAGNDVQMFSTTFAYMAALAIMQGYEQIYICGVELSSSEYVYQADSYRFWFGFLRGRLGVENVTNAFTFLNNNIFIAPLYGYEGGFSFTEEYFADRVKTLQIEHDASEKNLQNVRQALMTAMDKKEFDKVQRLTLDYQNASVLNGQYKGALEEAKRYQTFGSRDADRGGFESQAASAQKRLDEKKAITLHYGGMAEYVWNGWKQTKGQNGLEQMKHLISKMGEAAYHFGGEMGIFQENVLYINKYDDTMKANGVVLNA